MNNRAKKMTKMVGLTVFFVLIIVYALYRSHDLIAGVKIKNVKINGLSASSVVEATSDVLEITGQAKNAIDLTLNGREISIDEASSFNETIVLLAGYNIISIKARDKFGYIDEQNFRLMAN